MSEAGQTAYVTGGASGVGKAVVERLVSKGCKVFIADLNHSGAQSVAEKLNSQAGATVVYTSELNVTDWDSQVRAFEEALKVLGQRIDYVFPIAGIGERQWIPNDPLKKEWVKPDLTVLDVDLNAVFYTVALAVQQFRRQEKGKFGFRGKICCVASVCGIYCVPTLPIYTAAKHAITGFVRSYGKYLPEEYITLNSVNPNVIRTNISSSVFYDMVDAKGLLTSMEPLLDAFEGMLGGSSVSGEVFEIPPNGKVTIREAPGFLDRDSEVVCDMLYERGRPLHTPKGSG